MLVIVYWVFCLVFGSNAIFTSISSSSPEQMADWGVGLHLGEPVTSIDPASHKLATVAGEYAWDILVLAVGAHAFVPPVPGLAASSRVHVLRELPDADALFW